MPTEREKIERERMVATLKRLIDDFDELERDLQKLEAERGLPYVLPVKTAR